MCRDRDASQSAQQCLQVVWSSSVRLYISSRVKQKGEPRLLLALWPKCLTAKQYLFPPSLPPSHTLLCSQQSLPVPVWPQQQQLKEVKQGRGRLREKGPGGGECTALSAGFPLSDVYMHAHTQLAQEAACVANDQMGKDEVNLEVDQRGLPPLRIWLSKYQSSLPVSPALTHLCRGLKERSRARQIDMGRKRPSSLVKEKQIALIKFS